MISENTKPGIATAIALPGEPDKLPSISFHFNHKSNLHPGQASLIPAGAVKAIQVARNSLMSGQFALDDAGLECEMLNGLHARTVLLLGLWRGAVQINPETPAYIVEASVEWRARLGRSY